MNTLTCPLSLFQRILRLLTEDRHRPVFVQVGFHTALPDRTWLVRDVLTTPPSSVPREQISFFQITFTSVTPSLPLSPEDLPPRVVGMLWIGDAMWRGRLWGAVRTRDGIELLHQLSLVGAGMHVLPVAIGQDAGTRARLDDPTPGVTNGRWSRSIGALGGADIWQRLVRLKITVVGSGRTGSLVAHSLARLGIHNLTLIDPDVVEVHNLGEMDLVTFADLGQPKAEALAAHLHQITGAAPWNGHGSAFPSALAIESITNSVTTEDALAACKQADVVFSCVDNDAARLATSLAATLYHKPLFDIGTAVQFPWRTEPSAERVTMPPRRLMGADVRLIVPGHGCLLCVGNLRRYEEAMEELCHGGHPDTRMEPWHRQRAGSLRALNQFAAALSVLLLQDFIAERILTSQWVQAEFDDQGRLIIDYPALRGPNELPTCILCAKAGLGDEGLGWRRSTG